MKTGSTSFTFGDGRSVKSDRRIVLPCRVGNTVGSIRTDVVPRNIPLLLSRATMKKGKMTINFENDKATFLGRSFLAVKLHQQFGHPLKDKILGLTKSAGITDGDFKDEIVNP